MDYNVEIIRLLCTRAGILMEDASIVALVWDAGDALTMAERLEKLQRAAADIKVQVGGGECVGALASCLTCAGDHRARSAPKLRIV